MKIRLTNSVWVLLLVACSSNADPAQNNEEGTMAEQNTVSPIHYTLRNTYPHDTGSFTEGLLMHGGVLFESTGAPEDMRETRSLFGSVDLATGQITPKAELDRNKYFGEGIAILKDKVYQLTYQTRVGFIYDAKRFQQIGQFTFPSREGWGLTTDGDFLIMSDGTHTLTYLNPATFQVEKTLRVTNENGTVSMLNELEYIGGFIYANVYGTNHIVKIEVSSGRVVGRLDLTSLVQDAKLKHPASLELNGIAYDAASGTVYVTGKMWPHIYEIAFAH